MVPQEKKGMVEMDDGGGASEKFSDKLAKSRLSAKMSRERKKLYMELLETKVSNLEKEVHKSKEELETTKGFLEKLVKQNQTVMERLFRSVGSRLVSIKQCGNWRASLRERTRLTLTRSTASLTVYGYTSSYSVPNRSQREGASQHLELILQADRQHLLPSPAQIHDVDSLRRQAPLQPLDQRVITLVQRTLRQPRPLLITEERDPLQTIRVLRAKGHPLIPDRRPGQHEEEDRDKERRPRGLGGRDQEHPHTDSMRQVHHLY